MLHAQATVVGNELASQRLGTVSTDDKIGAQHTFCAIGGAVVDLWVI